MTRIIRTILHVTLLISLFHSAHGQTSEPTSNTDVSVVKHLILAREVGITLGVDWKRNVRLGDKSARLLSSVYTSDELVSPEKIRLFVPILTVSFEAIGWISDSADKCPNDTLKLFDRISKEVDDPDVIEIIANSRNFIMTETTGLKDCPSIVQLNYRPFGVKQLQ